MKDVPIGVMVKHSIAMALPAALGMWLLSHALDTSGIFWYMIVGASVAVVFAPFMALIYGECPYCKAHVEGWHVYPGVTCPACKQRILIRDKQYFKVPQ